MITIVSVGCGGARPRLRPLQHLQLGCGGQMKGNCCKQFTVEQEKD